jgi:hypothetical protein
MRPSHDPGWGPLTLFLLMVACLGHLSDTSPPAGEGSRPAFPAPAPPRLVAQSRASGEIHAVALSPDGRTLAAGGRTDQRGVLQLWDANSRRWLATLLVLGWEGGKAPQWIAYSPGGYYDGSPGVERFIRWRVGGQLFPGEQYERAFRRPDLVRRAPQGRPAPTPIPAPSE